MRAARALWISAVIPALATIAAACGPATPSPGPSTPEAPVNPLAGARLWIDPQAQAQQMVTRYRESGRAQDADLLAPIADQPVATWLSDDDPRPIAERVTTAAAAEGALPVLVVYHRPGRDCGSYSAGGSKDAAAYRAWLAQVVAGIGDRRALVIVEPDAVAQAASNQCPDVANSETTYPVLAEAVTTLSNLPQTSVYLDAGHPGWINDTGSLADALKKSGGEQADGFSLNVSNFQTTAANDEYGTAISSALGGKQYVVDVSRNGRGAPDAPDGSIDAWCNPQGVGLGENPRIAGERALGIAYLWVKEPGASDGACREGEPPAGTFWFDYAKKLIEQRRS